MFVRHYRLDWEETAFYNDTLNWKMGWPAHFLPYTDLLPKKPSGLRVVNYNQAGDYSLHNISSSGGVVDLYEGYNDLLFPREVFIIAFDVQCEGGESE